MGAAQASIPGGKWLLMQSELLQALLDRREAKAGAGLDEQDQCDGTRTLSVANQTRVLADVNGSILPVFIGMQATGEPPLEV